MRPASQSALVEQLHRLQQCGFAEMLWRGPGGSGGSGGSAAGGGGGGESGWAAAVSEWRRRRRSCVRVKCSADDAEAALEDERLFWPHVHEIRWLQQQHLPHGDGAAKLLM